MKPVLRRALQSVVICALVAGAGISPAAASDEVAVGAAWLNPSWSHRVLITVNEVALDGVGTLSDFPLVVDGEVLASAFPRSRPDGKDIVVTRSDGTTLLPTEVVHFDVGSTSAEVWFRADELSASSNQFYVYYGNSEPAASVAGAVWPDDYVAVYHFEENPELGTLKDYTAASNDARSDLGISAWTATDVDDGILGQGWKFNGSTHFISTNKVRTQDGGYTVSAWMLHDTRSTDFAFQSNPGFWHVSSQASNVTYNIQYQDIGVDVRWGPNPIALNEFHHFAWVFKPAQRTIEFYYDGNLRNPETFWPPETNPDDYYVGYPLNPDGNDLVGIMGPMFHNALDLMNGIGDEFRISDDEKSGAWIATEVSNQSSPGDFYAVGTEEAATPVGAVSPSRLKARY